MREPRSTESRRARRRANPKLKQRALARAARSHGQGCQQTRRSFRGRGSGGRRNPLRRERLNEARPRDVAARTRLARIRIANIADMGAVEGVFELREVDPVERKRRVGDTEREGRRTGFAGRVRGMETDRHRGVCSIKRGVGRLAGDVAPVQDGADGVDGVRVLELGDQVVCGKTVLGFEPDLGEGVDRLVEGETELANEMIVELVEPALLHHLAQQSNER